MTAPDKLLRPTWAEISLGALARNAERVRQLAGRRKVMAVVKADAYGHGAVQVAKCLAGSGSDPSGVDHSGPDRSGGDRSSVDWFGVATVEEGIELRAAGIEEPILLLGGLYMSDPKDLIEYRLIPSVSSTARLDTYAACALERQQSIEFHLKVDTGLGRLGVPIDRLRSFLERYQELEGLTMTGVFTHLASAEDLVACQTEEQVGRFDAALKQLPWFEIEPAWVHVSNSAALLVHPEISENLVRIGALLYGYYPPLTFLPGREPPSLPVFEPVLELKSRVVYLKDVPSGSPLGYGAAYYTRRLSRIATVPVGYADGLSRALSNRGRVIVNGRPARIVGNISMDLTLIDVTDIPGVAVGDEVTLIGRSEGAQITALEIASLLSTVPYEVLCSIGKRVPRIYVE